MRKRNSTLTRQVRNRWGRDGAAGPGFPTNCCAFSHLLGAAALAYAAIAIAVPLFRCPSEVGADAYLNVW